MTQQLFGLPLGRARRPMLRGGLLDPVTTGLPHPVLPTILLDDTYHTSNQLLMTLMYWREYRTEFHIGLTYGISEATVCRTIQKIENALMKSGEFRLPGRKALQPSDTLIEVVLIDATEQPIERPKKSNDATTAVKRSDIPKKRK
jgi:hypothetical protein